MLDTFFFFQIKDFLVLIWKWSDVRDPSANLEHFHLLQGIPSGWCFLGLSVNSKVPFSSPNDQGEPENGRSVPWPLFLLGGLTVRKTAKTLVPVDAKYTWGRCQGQTDRVYPKSQHFTNQHSFIFYFSLLLPTLKKRCGIKPSECFFFFILTWRRR